MRRGLAMPRTDRNRPELATGQMARPFFNDSTDKLRVHFNRHPRNRDEIARLLHELEYRRTPSAGALRRDLKARQIELIDTQFDRPLFRYSGEQLRSYFTEHNNDEPELASLLHELEYRTTPSAIELREIVQARLCEIRGPERPNPRWRLYAILAVVISALAAGIAQAAGNDIWRAVWPAVQTRLGL